jgi:hypothetical protein
MNSFWSLNIGERDYYKGLLNNYGSLSLLNKKLKKIYNENYDEYYSLISH